MNIAFYTYYECYPEIGGTERTTYIVADALSKYYGHTIYSIYSQPYDKKDSIKLNCAASCKHIIDDREEDTLVSFIRNNHIDVIINQGSFEFGLLFAKLKKTYHLEFKQVFALHFTPGTREEAGADFRYNFDRWKKNPGIKNIVKILSYPLYSTYIRHVNKSAYRKMSEQADKIVLLSDKYRRLWYEYGNIKHPERKQDIFSTIPNAIPFDDLASESDITNKEKRILIVCRLHERQKRVTKALKIWESIADDPAMSEWQLDIVGDGPDAEMYQSIIKDRDIPRVNLYGHRDPQPYYRRAAIFMMTSDYEGFPMTILEAMQNGTVPIVFDTFPSLTDIISDCENGFTIKSDDYSDYESKLIQLAKDAESRIRMGKNAVKKSREFSTDKIAGKWQKLISEIPG